MSVTRVTSPSAELMDDEVTTFFGSTPVVFRKGVAEISNISEGLKGYFQTHGYGIGDTEPEPAPIDPTPADPRDLENGGVVTVGTPLRDAAVNPDPAVDFLAPTNAGDANPHGPNVVSPEIHASQGVRPIKAGNVTFNGDTTAQSESEQTHTEAATDGTPVTLTAEEQDLLGLNTTDAGDPDAEEGDPEVLRADLGLDGDEDDESADTDDVPAEDLKGQDLNDALKAAELSTSGTADEKRARLAEYRAGV